MSAAEPFQPNAGVLLGDLSVLRESVRGQVLTPQDAAYDSARAVFNRMIDRRPALIIHCAGASDVVRGVNLARDEGLALAVRGGGHSVAGKSGCDATSVDRRRT